MGGGVRLISIAICLGSLTVLAAGVYAASDAKDS